MNILAISTRVPQLSGKGDELVSYWRIKALLAAGHTVHLICCTTSMLSSTDISALGVLLEMGVTFDIVKVSCLRQLFNLFAYSLFGRYPAQVALYKSNICANLIKASYDTLKPDCVHLFLVRSVANIAPFAFPKVTVDFIDSISLNFSRQAMLASFPLRLLLSIEAKRLHRLETALANSAICAFSVSQLDANYISSKNVVFLPIGVDSTRFVPSASAASSRIIFSGNMSYTPNITAISWFCHNCWLSILHELPDATLYICGSDPSPSILRLASCYASVFVTGKVPSMSKELTLSTVAIAPMQSGAGMQIKILEAMSCGVPVVTTALGLGSIGIFDDPHVVVANSAADFVASVVLLLKDSSLRSKLSTSSRDYVLRNHSWLSIGQRFVATLESHLSYDLA